MGSKFLQELINNGLKKAFFSNLTNNRSKDAKTALDIGRGLIQQGMNVISSPNNVDDSVSESRIKQAMEFLQKAAQTERSKEIFFFKTHSSKLPQEMVKYLNFESIETFDYNKFIIALNNIFKNQEQFKKLVQTEIERINSFNAEYDRILSGHGTREQKDQELQILRGRYSRENYYLQYSGEKMLNSLFNNQSNMSKLTSLILKNFGSQLFEIRGSNGNIRLNNRQFIALLALVTEYCTQLLATEFTSTYNVTEMLNDQNEALVQEIIEKRRDIISNMIESLKTNPGLESALTSIADQFGMVSEDSKRRFNVTKRQMDTLRAKLKSVHPNKDGQKLISDDEIEGLMRTILSVSAQGFYTGEDISIIDLLKNDIIAVLGGGKNPTDDFQAGQLILDFEYSGESKLNKQLVAIQQKYFREKIHSTGSYEDYASNIEQIRAQRKEQQELMNSMLQQVTQTGQQLEEFSAQHFNIHGTVKGYAGAGQHGSYFLREGGFGGAAFGPNLLEELKIVNNVMQSGGISVFTDNDQDLLITAAMNAGNHLIGPENKTPLENYFSVFAGLLMFNDASIMAEDALKGYSQIMEESNVQELHLYDLNGVKFPASYILQNTYDALIPLTNNLESDYGNSIRTTLYTYNQEQPKNKNVNATAEIVLNKTKFEIHFLRNFLGILEEIQKALYS